MAKNNNLTDFLTDTANAIRTKKGTTAKINPQDFSSEIASIQTGVDTSDATATANDILLGKTAYANGAKITGTIETYAGDGSETVNKLAALVDGTITEITADDLAGAAKIKDYTFLKCTSLTSVTIPYSIKSIEVGAFQKCTSLANIIIPEGITSIGGSAFQDCTSLANITIPNSVTSIGTYAFSDCSSITSVTIPGGVTRIRESVFYNCKSLLSATIMEGITSIGDSCFSYCTSLTSVTIPNSVTTITISSFSLCTSLASITIPSAVTSIGSNALKIGSATKKATITMLPTTPPTIQSSTFDTSKLEKIIVPAGTGATYKAATNWSKFSDYIEEAAE